MDVASNWGSVEYKPKQDPSNSWTFPAVTNSHFMMKWANNDDFDRLAVEITENSVASDLPTIFHFRYLNTREAFDITDGEGNGL